MVCPRSRRIAPGVAALVTGGVTVLRDQRLQDIARLKANPAVRVIEGPENRVIFLVMDQERPELRYSSVKGANPLKDLRVRQALYLAIDEESIRRQVMRGQAQVTGAMIPTARMSYPELEPRVLPYDLERAKTLLAEPGYAKGFEIGILCPNGRYVNDERICTALAGMFAKIGVKGRLDSLPRAQFFQRVHQFDLSMHLYGWGGAATDSGFTPIPVIHRRDGKRQGGVKSGRFIDPALDRMIDDSQVEMDPAKRRTKKLVALHRQRDHPYTLPLNPHRNA